MSAVPTGVLPMVRAFAMTVTLVCLPPAVAMAENCRIDTGSGKCIFVPFSQRTIPNYAVGDNFPIYEYNMLMNIDRYGLKPVDGPWRYYKSGSDIYKVSTGSHKVLAIIRNARRR